MYEAYFELMEHTESPYLFHRWCLISAVGTIINRQVYLPFGEGRIYPNQFVCLIGAPASRKSTAIKHIKTLVEESGYEHFASDRSSKEKFLIDMEFGFDRIARGEEVGQEMNELEEELFNSDTSTQVGEAYICAGELQDFLGNGNAGFISTLTNLWDNLPKYADRFKNSKSVFIANPTINMLGGATATTFAGMFNSDIIGQGMLSRLLLIYGAGARQKITIPPPLDGAIKANFVELFRAMRTSLHGACSFGAGAYEIIDQIYKTTPDLEDSRLLNYSGRRLDHLLKLCIVNAALELRLEITKEDVIKANTILSYTENLMPKALGEFGKSKLSEVTHNILQAITSGGDTGMNLPALWKKVNTDLDRKEDMIGILQKLQEADKIKITPDSKFVAVRREASSNNKHVNYKLLKEHLHDHSKPAAKSNKVTIESTN